MRKENMWKAAISGVLVLTLVATGITLYSTGKEDEPEEKQRNEAQLVENTGNEELNDEPFDSQDVSNGSVNAENYSDDENKNSSDDVVKPTEGADGNEDDSKDLSGDVPSAPNFTEDSVMVWPVNGKVLIDYSMETTTYFSTLDQYKCCNGVVLGAEAETAVQAAANGTIISIAENEETGLTVSMDLGNGYRAVYGQIKGLNAKVGDTVEQGEIFGYIAQPTKYYVKEGANLYFSMKKDGEYVDPMIYLETVVE